MNVDFLLLKSTITIDYNTNQCKALQIGPSKFNYYRKIDKAPILIIASVCKNNQMETKFELNTSNLVWKHDRHSRHYYFSILKRLIGLSMCHCEETQ